MTITPVDNTKQIPGRAWLAVQAATDAQAEAALKAAASRQGLTLDKAYKWGAGYYYAPVELEQR